jgi:predicted dehydrogenase
VTALQRDFLGRGLDDMSLTTVAYGEVPVTVEANYFVPGTHRECVIVGERGALVADYGDSTVFLHAGEHRRRGAAWEAVDAGKEELPARGQEPLRLELAAFLAACRGEGANPVPAEAGVHALEVVEAAALSSRQGRAVLLAEIR